MQNERSFRLDLIVALCALVISTIAALASVYQTRVIAQQLSAAVWPYLSLEHTYSSNSAELTMTNYGLGPALVRSAWLQYGGKNLNSWDPLVGDYRHAGAKLHGKHGSLQLSESSLGDGSVLSPGTTKRLLAGEGRGYGATLALRAVSDVTVRVCYCSLLGQCWIVDTRESGGPKPQRSCPVGPTIGVTPVLR